MGGTPAYAPPLSSAPPSSCLRLAWVLSGLFAASLVRGHMPTLLPWLGTMVPMAWAHTAPAGDYRACVGLLQPSHAVQAGAVASGMEVRCSPAMQVAVGSAGLDAGAPLVGCHHCGTGATCPILHRDTRSSRHLSLSPAQSSTSRSIPSAGDTGRDHYV